MDTSLSGELWYSWKYCGDIETRWEFLKYTYMDLFEEHRLEPVWVGDTVSSIQFSTPESDNISSQSDALVAADIKDQTTIVLRPQLALNSVTEVSNATEHQRHWECKGKLCD